MDNRQKTYLVETLARESTSSLAKNVEETLLTEAHWTPARVSEQDLSSDLELGLPHLYSMMKNEVQILDIQSHYACEVVTEQREAPGDLTAEDEWCICGVVGDGPKKMKIVRCMDSLCSTDWFHRDCVLKQMNEARQAESKAPLKRMPSMKNWMCRECGELRHKSTTKERTWKLRAEVGSIKAS
jgi:hypothetical protein